MAFFALRSLDRSPQIKDTDNCIKQHEMNNSSGHRGTLGASPAPKDWESIRRWRNSRRAVLIQARIGIGKINRRRCLQDIQSSVIEILSDLPPGIIGFYWPIKGEFDLRKPVEDFLEQGWKAALPVVVKAGTPLEFRLWRPEMKLVPGVWNIPIPRERRVVTPTVLLIPLVGFDAKNYRLGYGGGYYDRTLASLDNRPLTIGVGLESSRLETIYPQWHDITMDSIVTAAIE